MNTETIIAVYDTVTQAEAAVRDLRATNLPADAISQYNNPEAATERLAYPPHERGFWSRLFGGEPEHGTEVYERSLDSGSTVVAVRTPEAYVTTVTSILEAHNPIDIDERATGYGLSQIRTPLSGEGEASDRIQLSEEQIHIGKRVINRGTTRIRRFVVETPVEEQVTLRDENVTVERHAVADGTQAANPAFTDKTIEMTESSEEAVVAKTARVKEEVSLRKEVKDRVETVKDSVRREDVEIKKAQPNERDLPREGLSQPVRPASPENPRGTKI